MLFCRACPIPNTRQDAGHRALGHKLRQLSDLRTSRQCDPPFRLSGPAGKFCQNCLPRLSSHRGLQVGVNRRQFEPILLIRRAYLVDNIYANNSTCLMKPSSRNFIKGAPRRARANATRRVCRTTRSERTPRRFKTDDEPERSTMSALRLEGVSIRFGAIHALAMHRFDRYGRSSRSDGARVPATRPWIRASPGISHRPRTRSSSQEACPADCNRVRLSANDYCAATIASTSSARRLAVDSRAISSHSTLMRLGVVCRPPAASIRSSVAVRPIS